MEIVIRAMDIAVDNQGILPGLDDVVSQLGSKAVNSDLLLTTAKAIRDADIPIPATMGVWDNLSSLIEWCRGKKIVRELSEQTIQLPWFECHVPRHGTTQVSFESTQGYQSTIGLKIFGSGLSSGQSLKVTATEESEPRSCCARYVLDIRVLPKVYAFKGKESVQIEILGKAGTRIITQELCPYCSIEPEAIDNFENILDPYIDLRKDVVDYIHKVQLNWKNVQTIEIGIKPPSLETTFTVSAGVSSDAVWGINYKIRSGYFYQPYRRMSSQQFQPPMWAFKR